MILASLTLTKSYLPTFMKYIISQKVKKFASLELTERYDQIRAVVKEDLKVSDILNDALSSHEILHGIVPLVVLMQQHTVPGGN